MHAKDLSRMAKSPTEPKLKNIIEQTLERVNRQSDAKKIPLEFSAFAWYESTRTQVILLSPKKDAVQIPAEVFAKIGELQIEFLKQVRNAKLPIKITFVADGSGAVLQMQSLNPVNYDNIAGKLIEQSPFDRQMMILDNPVLKTGLRSGVFILSQIDGTYKDRFYVMDSINAAQKKLDQLYN